MEIFLGKYRIPSARASWWDYAANADYFITICTAHRHCLFGHILPQTAEMISSPLGEIVQEEWQKCFVLRTELFCDAFIIMPNHVHAIMRIDGSNVETHSRASLQTQIPTNPGVAYRPLKSIPSFVAGFKSAATPRITEFRNRPQTPVWRPRYHHYIIRNQQEYQRIKNYIENNPQHWRWGGNDNRL